MRSGWRKSAELTHGASFLPPPGGGAARCKILCTTQRVENDKLYESTDYALANIRIKAERSVVSGSATIAALRQAT